MGESKRRKAQLGEKYGQAKRKLFGFELNEAFKAKLIKWTIEGVIVSAIVFAVFWVTLPRLDIG